MIHAREDYNRIQDPENKIPEDEPVFLLRGQDINTPFVISHWAELNERSGGDPKLTKLARQHAKQVREWQKANGSKVADY